MGQSDLYIAGELTGYLSISQVFIFTNSSLRVVVLVRSYTAFASMVEWMVEGHCSCSLLRSNCQRSLQWVGELQLNLPDQGPLAFGTKSN